MKETLRLIVLEGSKEFGKKVDKILQQKYKTKTSFIVPIKQPRFSNGESKVVILETIRQKDVYIIADVGNHSSTYKMFDYVNHYSPDEHFQDIKRTISAIKGHASSITVIMPLLYEARQHRRKGRESLDCAVALQELEALGVHTIVTFDVHDPNIQNAIPNMSFENFYPTNTILENFSANEKFTFDELLVVSPDTGAMDRARYYADILGTDVGMFYKRRDLSKVVNGSNPIVAHEYMGKEVQGKTVLVVDDMIASGNSILEVAEELKKRGAKKIYLFATFSLFTSGSSNFDKAYKEGIFNQIYSTNLSYILPEIQNKKWFHEVDCSTYLAEIITCFHNHMSITPLMNGKKELMDKIKKNQRKIKKD